MRLSRRKGLHNHLISGETRVPQPDSGHTTTDLREEAAQAQEVLFEARTIFLFTPFPHRVTIDRVKATIEYRYFWWLSQATSIQIEDVLNVAVSVGPFFGSIKLWTRFYINAPLRVNYLSRSDAQSIKGILQGYVIARHRGVDTSIVPQRQLVDMLLQLGRGTSEHEPSVG